MIFTVKCALWISDYFSRWLLFGWACKRIWPHTLIWGIILLCYYLRYSKLVYSTSKIYVNTSIYCEVCFLQRSWQASLRILETRLFYSFIFLHVILQRLGAGLISNHCFSSIYLNAMASFIFLLLIPFGYFNWSVLS